MKYLEIPIHSEIDAIISFYHDVTHTGVNTTIESIINNYDWSGIHDDVRYYVRFFFLLYSINSLFNNEIKTCHDCQTSATLQLQPQRELQPIPPPQQPWYYCGIDLICNMPINTFGFQHILVIVCYLSKFVIARPLKTKTSKEILERLEEIYLTFGVPKIIQHDQGPEFASKVCLN